MKFTNKAKTHPAIAGYLQSQHYFLKGDISTTGLIKPPRETLLCQRHDDEIIVDVSKNYKSKAGTEFHAGVQRWIEKNQPKGVMSEKKLRMDINNWVVTGTADIIDYLLHQLWDIKNASVWAKIFGAKHEYQAQLNIYKVMAEATIEYLQINELFIAFGFTDWHKSDLYKKDYPKLAIDVLEIPVWPKDKTIAYMEDRVAYHQDAINEEDDNLPYCTGHGTVDNERWEKPSKFAVYKGGYTKAKRASKLENTLDKANAWVAKQKEPEKYLVYHRLGEQTKCKDWCDAAPFCNQWKELQDNQMEAV
jgi:hypothetical protein